MECEHQFYSSRASGAVAGFTAAALCGPRWVNGMLDTLKKTSPEMCKGMPLTGRINKTEAQMVSQKKLQIEAMRGPEAHLLRKCGATHVEQRMWQHAVAKMNERSKKTRVIELSLVDPRRSIVKDDSVDAWYDMVRFGLVRQSLRHVGVIAFALTASHDEGCVVRSRFKHQLSQLSLSLRKA